jgi:potassium inwardly-rectifying channel subfamily J, other
VAGASTFAGFFLLSVESQVSTGYGTWFPTEECPETITLLIIQLIFGVIIDATMVGILYHKMIRPPKYSEFVFSKKSVICQRDGKLCLIFRVADFKQAHSIDSKIRAYLFQEKITAEGERVGKSQQRLKLEHNGRVFLILPTTVCHIIDKGSPFYDMSARDLLQKRFEIVLSLTGVSQRSGQMRQARTSYLTKEILWGHRFVNATTYNREEGQYFTHVDKLDETEQIDTALCSAQRLDEIIQELHDVLERDAMQNLNINNFPELDDEDENDDTSFITMGKKSGEISSQASRDKFVVTKSNEKSE